MNAPFIRENRFLALKWDDIRRYLPEDKKRQLYSYVEMIAVRRLAEGKKEHQYVVVADDWPEYEVVWGMIEARCAGVPSEIEQLRAECAALQAKINAQVEAPLQAPSTGNALTDACLAEVAKKEAPIATLSVKVASMHESNGRITWMVFLAKSPDAVLWDCHQVYSDAIEGRARYVAAELAHFLDLGPKPDIFDFDIDPPEQCGYSTSNKNAQEIEQLRRCVEGWKSRALAAERVVAQAIQQAPVPPVDNSEHRKSLVRERDELWKEQP